MPKSMLAKEARAFLEMLGHRGDLARVQRVQHPDKRLHLLYEASHPKVGAVTATEEREAWDRLCDLAEKGGALPDRCQATKKNGEPCKNTPQRGERYCGSHLGESAPSTTAAAPVEGLCKAKTKKGRPCQNAPQKGEAYCGPHLEQRRRSS